MEQSGSAAAPTFDFLRAEHESAINSLRNSIRELLIGKGNLKHLYLGSACILSVRILLTDPDITYPYSTYPV